MQRAADDKGGVSIQIRIDSTLFRRLEKARKSQSISPTKTALITYLIDQWCKENGT